MKLTKKILALALISGLVAARTVEADETSDAISALKQQIQELSDKVRALERQREADTKKEFETKPAGARPKETPQIVVGNNGLIVTSADTNFSFGLHGVLQVDNRTFFRDGGLQGNDGFLIRRARPILQGTVYHDFDFLFVPDFAGSSAQIFDAYLNYRYRPWLQLRAGKSKVPVGLENLQSDPQTSFNERSLATALTPGRDLGFQLWGDVADARLSYAIGVFNGVGDGRNSSNCDFEDHRELAARLFLQPFRRSGLKALEGFGFGVGGSWGNVSSNVSGLPSTTGGAGSSPPAGYPTDGQQQFFAYTPTNAVVAASGDHWRVAPQAYYYWGPLGFLGEYVISHQRVVKGTAAADLEHRAWQITASWVLTGEDASYNGVVPKHPFDPAAGHWGAVQWVGRYAELDIDNAAFPTFANPLTSASAARAWAVGLNWYLNKNFRVNASFSRTTFTGGGTGASAPAAVTRQPEEVFFTRLQLAF